MLKSLWCKYYPIDNYSAINSGINSATNSAIKSSTSFNTWLISFIGGVCLTLLFRDLVDVRLLCCLIVVIGYASFKKIIFLPLLVGLIGFSWATFLFGLHYENHLPTVIEGQTISIRGELQGLPQNSNQSPRFYFKVTDANLLDGVDIPELSDQTIIISCYRCKLVFAPDQQWQLSVRLKRPHSYASWGAFDYEKYLFRKKVIATAYVREKETNTLLSAGQPKSLLSVDMWRWQIRAYLNQTLTSNESGKAIIAALMIGDKSQFTKQHKQVFQQTGISHLMAISGLHIGLAFMVTCWLLKWLFAPVATIYNWVPRQKLVLLPALIVAFGYAALAGFAISTQRAMIMLTLFVLVRFLAREVSLLKVLMMTIFVIFVYDPFSILDVGFWLSCFAVLVIALAGEYQAHVPDLDSDSKPEQNQLSLIKLQPILWLSMLPITLLFFGKISLLSPFVNLLLVPLFCGLLIPLTLLALALKIIGLQAIGTVLIELLSHCYEWLYTCLAWSIDMPYAQLAMPPMQLIDWSFFSLVGLAYFKAWRFRHILALGFVVLLMGFTNPKKLDSNEFNVVLLDVGQGLAMVVEAPDYVLVYDTGPAYRSGFITAEAVLIPYLQRHGVTKIDTLIVSHADNDHIGGFSALQSAINIDQILTSRVDKIPEATNCEKGQHWSVADIEFKIISPETDTPDGSNNRSCVLMVSNGHVNVLISGDIEKQVERHLLNNEISLKADILLVPHQGSKTSSTAEFIDTVSPNLALIAAGYRNHYGHPHDEVVARYKEHGANIYSTIESGSISLNIKGNDWVFVAYRTANKGFWNHLKKQT